MIYMFLSNNPSSGDINSSNLPCLICNMTSFSIKNVMTFLPHLGVESVSKNRICD